MKTMQLILFAITVSITLCTSLSAGKYYGRKKPEQRCLYDYLPQEIKNQVDEIEKKERQAGYEARQKARWIEIQNDILYKENIGEFEDTIEILEDLKAQCQNKVIQLHVLQKDDFSAPKESLEKLKKIKIFGIKYFDIKYNELDDALKQWIEAMLIQLD